MHKKWTKRKGFGLANFTHIEAAIGTPKDKMQHFQAQNATPKMQHPNQRSLPPCFFLVFLVPIVVATLCACEAIRLPVLDFNPASSKGTRKMGRGKINPRKKHVLQSVVASHRGDIEARMGKPRKKHVLQSAVFSFFPPSLPPTEVT